MNEKMTVVYVKETGHVLGAVTSVAAPGQGTAASLVGEGLPVRETAIPPVTPDMVVQLVVPTDSLDAKPVDYKLEAFGPPGRFAANGGVVAKLPETVSPDLLSKLTLTQSQVQLTLVNQVTEPIKIWIALEEVVSTAGIVPERRVMSDTIVPTDVTSKNVFITLRAGGPIATIAAKKNYNVLFFAAGYPPRFSKEILP